MWKASAASDREDALVQDHPALTIYYVGTLPPHPGGSAISGGQLLERLAAAGHHVEALASIESANRHEPDRFAAAHPAIKVMRYPVASFFTSVHLPPDEKHFRDEGAHVQANLRSRIARSRPDVVFVGRELLGCHVAPVTHEANLPCVLRAAGGTLVGLKTGCFQPAIQREIIDGLAAPDLVITPGAHMIETLGRLGIHRTRHIPNAVDLRQFAPRPKPLDLARRLNIGPDDCVVALVGRLSSRKRPLDLARAAAHALAVDPRLLFLVIGTGELRDEMEAQVRSAGIVDRFRFSGWLPYARVADHMNLADIVVMASDGEGLARVYLEAQASGKVLLASSIAPAREVVRDGDTGVLFELGNSRDLAQKILALAADAPLRARIGRQARLAVQAHSLDLAVPRFVRAFRDVLGGKPPPPRSGLAHAHAQQALVEKY